MGVSVSAFIHVGSERTSGTLFPLSEKKSEIYRLRNILNSLRTNVLFDNLEITTNQTVDRSSPWLTSSLEAELTARCPSRWNFYDSGSEQSSKSFV